jgi:hypothetical protein
VRVWLRGRLEPRQRRPQGIKARRVRKSVAGDDAPDCRGHGGKLVVGEINCRHVLSLALSYFEASGKSLLTISHRILELAGRGAPQLDGSSAPVSM